MTYVIRDEAVLQAVSLCWLFRAHGLFATGHGERCAWCDYPVDELALMRADSRTDPLEWRTYWGSPREYRRLLFDRARAL